MPPPPPPPLLRLGHARTEPHGKAHLQLHNLDHDTHAAHTGARTRAHTHTRARAHATPQQRHRPNKLLLSGAGPIPCRRRADVLPDASCLIGLCRVQFSCSDALIFRVFSRSRTPYRDLDGFPSFPKIQVNWRRLLLPCARCMCTAAWGDHCTLIGSPPQVRIRGKEENEKH